MPVPKAKEGKYGIIVASQTKRLKKKGMSGSAANKKAKKMADKAIMGKKKKGKK